MIRTNVPHLQEVLDLVKEGTLDCKFKIYQEVAEACRIVLLIWIVTRDLLYQSFNLWWFTGTKIDPKVIRAISHQDIYKEVDCRKES